MSIRKITFENDEYYHVLNRGADKRNIFRTVKDVERFLKSMEFFNDEKPTDGIKENEEELQMRKHNKSPLVEVICFCLNPNHYHLILRQLSDGGVEKFMHKLGTGYTMYFNKKYRRTGVLFQGKFKAFHLNSDEKLLYTSVYVNLNNKIHKIGKRYEKLTRSSWEEYVGDLNKNLCEKEIILGQFKNTNEYKEYAMDTKDLILENKTKFRELEKE